MKERILLDIGIALAIALAAAGGWLAANYYAAANPPGFEILDDYAAEIPLIHLESFDGRILKGNYEGVQPRFLLGEKEEPTVPEKDKTFQLDLKVLK